MNKRTFCASANHTPTHRVYVSDEVGFYCYGFASNKCVAKLLNGQKSNRLNDIITEW